jgi:hypothetical protein
MVLTAAVSAAGYLGRCSNHNSPRTMDTLQVGDAAPPFGETCVVFQGSEDVSLPQGQENLGVIFRVRHDEVLDLMAIYRQNKPRHAAATIWGADGTSSPQSMASRSLPFALFHISSSCCAVEGFISIALQSPKCAREIRSEQRPGCHTLIPQERTRCACFLASDQSRAVPSALERRYQHWALASNSLCRCRWTHDRGLAKRGGRQRTEVPLLSSMLLCRYDTDIDTDADADVQCTVCSTS